MCFLCNRKRCPTLMPSSLKPKRGAVLKGLSGEVSFSIFITHSPALPTVVRFFFLQYRLGSTSPRPAVTAFPSVGMRPRNGQTSPYAYTLFFYFLLFTVSPGVHITQTLHAGIPEYGTATWEWTNLPARVHSFFLSDFSQSHLGSTSPRPSMTTSQPARSERQKGRWSYNRGYGAGGGLNKNKCADKRNS